MSNNQKRAKRYFLKIVKQKKRKPFTYADLLEAKKVMDAKCIRKTIINE